MLCTRIADQKLHTNFYDVMEKYFNNYEKLAVQGRKDRNMHKRAADPILFSLFVAILKWFIKSDNMLL